MRRIVSEFLLEAGTLRICLSPDSLIADISIEHILSQYIGSLSPATTKAQDLAELFSLNASKSVEFFETQTTLTSDIAQLEEEVERLELGGDATAADKTRAMDQRGGVRQRSVKILLDVGQGASDVKDLAIKIQISYRG